MSLHPLTRAQVHFPKIVPTRVMEEMQRTMHTWLGGTEVSKIDVVDIKSTQQSQEHPISIEHTLCDTHVHHHVASEVVGCV